MKEYEVEINGIPHTFLMDDDFAKSLGLKPVSSKAAEKPKNKAAKPPANKAD